MGLNNDLYLFKKRKKKKKKRKQEDWTGGVPPFFTVAIDKACSYNKQRDGCKTTCSTRVLMPLLSRKLLETKPLGFLKRQWDLYIKENNKRQKRTTFSVYSLKKLP